MSKWLEQNKKPLMQAFLIFFILFGLVLLLTFYYDFSNVDLKGLLFMSALLCCLFVAKNTFDITKSSLDANKIKETTANEIAFSSEELYVQLYKNSPVPYLLIDIQGHIQSANVAAVRLLNIAQTEVKGINIFRKIETEADSHLDLLVEKYKNRVAFSDEMVMVKRPDDSMVWVLMSLFSFTDKTGREIGLLTFVDITKQKKAEDAKSEFVSLASHQLRTPIAGMKWSAELLQMDNPELLTERQHKYIERLLISIKRMAVLVDDFLRVSRFELGTFQPEYGNLNLSDLFEDIISEQSPRAKQKNLKVKKFFDSDISVIVSDQNLLRMIVTNIYSNATKYSNENGTVHIGYKHKGDSLIISIADNGIGIPPEDQSSIFSKLFRASNAIRNVPDGTGLGLYIVREAVRVLNGSVSFTTTENIGTTFEVVLPLELPEKD